MIDDPDYSASTLRLLVFQALKAYTTPVLIPMLEDDDYIVRSAVARELQNRGGDEAFDAAVNLISSTIAENREISAFLLGQLGTPQYPYRSKSIPLLVRLLGDDNHEVRSGAVAALGHLTAYEVVDDIIALEQDESSEVRESVAFSLSMLHDSVKATDSLMRLRRDLNPSVKEWADLGLELRNEHSQL